MSKWFLMPILLLSACTPAGQMISDASNKCPQIGIDINAPDFYQKYKRAELEGFYACMQEALRPSAGFTGEQNAIIRTPGLIRALQHDDMIKNRTQAMLAYQKNLWRQIFDKEKKPGAAQQAWMEWVSDITYKQASVDAADRTAGAVNQQNFQMQQQNMQLQQIQHQQRWQQMQQQMNGY